MRRQSLDHALHDLLTIRAAVAVDVAMAEYRNIRRMSDDAVELLARHRFVKVSVPNRYVIEAVELAAELCKQARALCDIDSSGPVSKLLRG